MIKGLTETNLVGFFVPEYSQKIPRIQQEQKNDQISLCYMLYYCPSKEWHILFHKSDEPLVRSLESLLSISSLTDINER